MPALTYGSESMIGRENGIFMIYGVQMDDLRGYWVSGEWIKSRIHGEAVVRSDIGCGRKD